MVYKHIFYSKAEILPVDLKIWFKSSIEDFKKYPVKRLKQWIANTKKVFKIHKKNHNYDSNKITDYFLKIGGRTETQINRNKNLPPRNNDLTDSNVNTTFTNYEVANSQKPSITNNYSNYQNLSEQTFENNIMSIPDYLSYSTVNSSSNSNYTVINTKKYTNKNSNRYFQSDSDSIPNTPN